MMKKVLYGVALTLFAGVSVGSLQSCKDDLGDYQTQTSYDLTKLRGQLDAESARLEGLITAEAAARQADITTVKDLIGDLQTADRHLAEEIEGAKRDIKNIQSLIPEMSEGDKLASQSYVDGECKALKAEIEALAGLVDEGDAALVEMIENAQKYAEWLDKALKDEIEEELDEIRDEIVKIENAIDSIIQHIDKQVTGILIQGVYSPVFGDFSLPIGIRSNMLFNWYGQNVWNEGFDFPSASETFSATGNPGLDLSKIAPAEYYKVPAGYFGDADKSVTLGTVYATLNPVGAKFDHLDVNLETSAGTRLPWPVSLKPSNREIKFGYTRDGEESGVEVNTENGFYEGELVVPVEEALSSDYKIEVQIEQSLKTAMKDALKNPSMTTAKALVKGVYDQLSGKIPAYAMRYDWTTPGVGLDVDPGFSLNAYSVLSQYDLAVATSKPLSYNFLAGYEGSRKFPEPGHIQNLIFKLQEEGDLHFTFDPITFDDIEITLPPITISASDVQPGETTVKATIDPISVKKDGQEIGKTETSTVDVNINSVVSDLTKKINESINKIKTDVEGWSGSADDDISNQLQTQLGKIANQINDMMDSINGQIDNMITNIGDKFQPYFDKVNKAIDIYNKVANKLNNFLVNPNAYLQVAAFYNMGGNNYGLVSGKASDPTPFVGDGEAFKLYLSSYTGELIVPACKKYVAITAAPEGVDVAALNTGALNKVLDGNQIAIMVAKPTVKGVYEFTYQALDYSGYTSTKKFYIEVK